MTRAFFLAAALAASPVAADVVPGQPAPAFTLPSAAGRPVSLADYRGKVVVLEWNNPGCPFVRKHYGSGNMQRIQAAAERDGAVWLTVNSGAPGKQGNMDAAQAAAFVRAQHATPTAYLLDPAGKVGRAYGARTTPHMFVIDRAGRVAYAGGIDDKPTADPADIGTARNLALAAVTDLAAGRPVAVAESRPYGCSVKYAD